MVLHPGQHLIDLCDLPGARGVAAVEQQAVRLVEDEHGIRLARFLEGVRDMAFGLTEIGTEDVRRTLLNELQPKPASEIARERRLPRAGRSGKADREGARLRAHQPLGEGGKILVRTDEQRIEIRNGAGFARYDTRDGTNDAERGTLDSLRAAA